MDQQLIWKASILEKQVREIEEKVVFLDNQILELEKFLEQLNYMEKNESKDMLSSIGRGLYLKTSLEDRHLFVEVGAGVIVKKTPKEVANILENQIKRFREARMHLSAQIEMYHRNLEEAIVEIEASAKKANKN